MSILFSLLLCFFASAEVDQGNTNADSELVRAKLPEWEKVCATNDGFTCGNIGAAYALGKGVARNPTKALEYYEKACRFGQGMRCTRAGVMLLNGEGATQSVERAADLFRLGCATLDADSCVNYYAVTHGKTIQQTGETIDMPEALRTVEPDANVLNQVLSVLTVACVRKVAKACGNLGGMYEEGSATPRDLVKALEFYLKACDLGEAERCARAGRYVANNVGGKSVVEGKAAKLFEKSCELKKMDTCPLAHRARSGLTIELNLTEPKRNPVKSTAQTFTPPPPDKVPPPAEAKKTQVVAVPEAESDPALAGVAVVGSPKNSIPNPANLPEPLRSNVTKNSRLMVEAPKNTPPWARYPITYPIQTEGMTDEVKALVQSCNRGNARSCGNAGALLVDDSGKPRVFPEATRQLFERACGLGRAQRCFDLSRFHAHGWGTEISVEREKAALKEACRLGHKPSCAPMPEVRNLGIPSIPAPPAGK